jgi:predicted acylesterase/phospholipase RssA
MYRFWQSASADLAAMARDLKFVWEAKGMHSSEPLRTWLDKVLDYKRFEHLEGIQNGIPDLRIVATSVSTQEYQVYDSARHGGMELAEAVHASVSIPIFFQPFVTGGGSRFLVDGGVLSNFPSFLFAQSPDPTIGLRLEDLPPLTRIEEIERAPGKPLPIRSTLDYLLLLLKTMVEAHDAFRELPPDFHLYRVPVPDDISFDKFDLTKVDVDRLYDKATQVKVNWEDDSRSSGKPRTFDPNPQQALTFGIEQGAALIQRHYSPDMWAQSFEQTVHFEVTIEEDWSSLYQRTMELKVEGEQPIFVIRLVSSGLPKGPNSLADHVPKYEEIVDGKNSRKNVILIPASNEAESKGFVAFLDPPLRGGVGPRKFWMEQRIKEEFANVGKSGGSGLISYYARQRAKTHVLKLQIQVRVAEKLGELTFKSETDEQIIPGPLYEDPATHRIYRVYTSGMHEIPVNREGGIAVYFRRA